MSDKVVQASYEGVITKSDLRKIFLRLDLFGEASLNFERMQAVGWCYAISPALKKLYPQPEDYAKALTRHLQFFNTQLTWGTLIMGPTIALEEEKSRNPELIPDEAITGFKSGLMGPVAALGDSIEWATINGITNALSASLGAAGNVAGFMILIVRAIWRFIQAGLLFAFGWKIGRTSLKSIMSSGLLEKFLTGAGILGLYMMGVLSANLVKLNTTFGFGTFSLQTTLDNIAQGILPLSAVFVCYWLIRHKKVRIVNIVFIIIAFSVLGSLIGIV